MSITSGSSFKDCIPGGNRVPGSNHSSTTSPQLLHELISHSAQRDAGHTALICADESIDYGRLAANCAGFAAGLQALNIQPGVSHQELAHILPMIENATIGRVQEMIARGGSRASAFAV